MSKHTLVKGAVVLGLAGVFVKLLGAVFRLPLANMISATGMANYSPAYYIYSFFLILATAGIPVAISKMVSEARAVGNHYRAHRIFTLATMLMAGIGTVSFIILFFFAPTIAEAIHNPESALAMRAISPSLIMVPIMAAYRGYFQGMQNMKPTAVSQVIEQLFRVVIGLLAAYLLFSMTKEGFFTNNFDKYERGAAGANFGATAGSFGGLLMILLIYFFSKPVIVRRVETTEHLGCEQGKEILRKILIMSVPITIGAAIMPIINLVDAGMVVGRLQSGSGFSYDEAKSLYGQLSGFVGPLINFPQVLTQAVAMSLVPVVAEAFKLKDGMQLRKNVMLGLRMTVIIGFPCALGLFALAKPILLLLYPRQAESAVSAAPILAIMAIGVIFLAIVQTLTGVLQGVSRQMIPVRNLAIGVIFKVILTFILTGIPAVNVKGAALGTVAAYATASVLNIIAVKRYTGASVDVMKTFGKPFLAALFMGAVVKLFHTIFCGFAGNSISTLISVFIGVVCYGIMILVTRTVTPEELEILPKGHKLAAIARKLPGVK